MLSSTSIGAPASTSSPDRQRRRDDQRGRGRAHDAALVAADPVRDAVHLDQVDRPVRVGDAAGTGAPLTTIWPVCSSNRSSSTSAVCTSPPPEMPTRNRCGPIRATLHPVADAAQLEVERAAALVLHLRAAAVRGGQQPLPLDALLVLVRLDRGGGQRDRGVPVADQAALGADPVDPAGVGAGVDHLGLVEQVEHEALVGRAALDDHRGLGHRPAQPAQRLVAVAAVRDDLRDHRVEVGRDACRPR